MALSLLVYLFGVGSRVVSLWFPGFFDSLDGLDRGDVRIVLSTILALKLFLLEIYEAPYKLSRLCNLR